MLPTQTSFLLNLILCVFATYRVSRMIAQEDGPLEVFQAWRDDLFNKLKNNWISMGFHCTLCISFWLSIVPALYLGWLFYLGIVEVITVWLSIAGIVVFLYRQERN